MFKLFLGKYFTKATTLVNLALLIVSGLSSTLPAIQSAIGTLSPAAALSIGAVVSLVARARGVIEEVQKTMGLT